MSKRAQLDNGDILEFPDDTPDIVMDMAVKRHVAGQPDPVKPPRPMGPAQPPTVADFHKPSLKSALDVPLDIGIGVERALGVDPMHPIQSILPDPKTRILDLAPVRALKDLVTSPLQTTASLADQISKSIHAGGQALREGDLPEAAQAVGSGWAGGEMGKGAVNLARTAVGGPLKAVLPSTERAGVKFQQIKNSVGDNPVNTTLAQQVAERAKELDATGSTMPKVLRKFIAATKSPGEINGLPIAPDPIPYSQGFDFASKAKQLSAAEKQAIKKTPMEAQVSRFAKEMHEANRDVAAQGGMGDMYDQAMKEYSQAMSLQDKINVAKKWGTRALLGYLGVKEGRQLLGF